MSAKGGITKGKSHAEGGIPMVVKSTGQQVELEGGEGVINKRNMASTKTFDFEGKKMTICEIASKINSADGNGVQIDCDNVTGTKYKYEKGGKILNEDEESEFKIWFEDGNVIEFEKGVYSTQDAQYSNKLKGMDELRKYFRKEFLSDNYQYSEGGNVNQELKMDYDFRSLLLPNEKQFFLQDDTKAIQHNNLFIFTDGKREIVFSRRKTKLKKLGNASKSTKELYDKYFADGGYVDLETYNFNELKGKYVNLYTMGVELPTEHQIVDITLTSPQFRYRDLTLKFNLGNAKIKFEDIEDFLNEEIVYVKTDKEEFGVQLIPNQFAKGGRTKNAMKLDDYENASISLDSYEEGTLGANPTEFAKGGFVVYAENEEGYYRKISEHDTMRGAKTKMNNVFDSGEYEKVGAISSEEWEKNYAPYQFKEGGGVDSIKIGDEVIWKGNKYLLINITSDLRSGFYDKKYFLSSNQVGVSDAILDSLKDVQKSKYAKGGEIDLPKANKMFHLPLELAVYVPSTQDVDKVISDSELKERVDEVSEYLARLFGGFTKSDKIGGFMASNSELVTEDVVPVVSFATKSDFNANKEKLVNKLSEWAKRWGQEAIGFEFEGDLYYVPENFAKGGNINKENYGKMTKHKYANGGGVEKHKYVVQWLEDDNLNREYYYSDEYEEAKELYYQIKYDLGDSQYKKIGINIMDIETGEVVFGDEFEYANGGGVDGLKRFDVDFYDSSDANRDTSVEIIIRQNSLENAIEMAIKKAYDLQKNYIEFYYKNLFLGSINFATSKYFREGKDYDKFMSDNKYANGGEVEKSSGLNYGKKDDVYFDVVTLLNNKMQKPKNIFGQEKVQVKTMSLDSLMEYLEKYKNDIRYEVDLPIELFTKESFHQYTDEGIKFKFVSGKIFRLGKEELLKKKIDLYTKERGITPPQKVLEKFEKEVQDAPAKTAIVQRIHSQQLLAKGGRMYANGGGVDNVVWEKGFVEPDEDSDDRRYAKYETEIDNLEIFISEWSHRNWSILIQDKRDYKYLKSETFEGDLEGAKHYAISLAKELKSKGFANGGIVQEDAQSINTIALLNGVRKSENTFQEFKRKLTQIIKRNGYRMPTAKAFEIAYETNQFANGGGIYSSDELYIVKVFDLNGNLLDSSKRVWARNLSKAKEIAIDDFEYDMQKKYGKDLRFRVEEAPSMFAKGGDVRDMSWYKDFKKQELKRGTEHEMEHIESIKKFKKKGVSDREVAKAIAKDHLDENENYYIELDKMKESSAKVSNALQDFDHQKSKRKNSRKYKLGGYMGDNKSVNVHIKLTKDHDVVVRSKDGTYLNDVNLKKDKIYKFGFLFDEGQNVAFDLGNGSDSYILIPSSIVVVVGYDEEKMELGGEVKSYAEYQLDRNDKSILKLLLKIDPFSATAEQRDKVSTFKGNNRVNDLSPKLIQKIYGILFKNHNIDNQIKNLYLTNIGVGNILLYAPNYLEKTIVGFDEKNEFVQVEKEIANIVTLGKRATLFNEFELSDIDGFIHVYPKSNPEVDNLCEIFYKSNKKAVAVGVCEFTSREKLDAFQRSITINQGSMAQNQMISFAKANDYLIVNEGITSEGQYTLIYTMTKY